MRRNNVSVLATDNSYAILFSREDKTPHVIFGKGEKNDYYGNLLTASTRCMKLVKTNSVVFRTNNERIRDLIYGKASPDANELEFVQMLTSRKIKVFVGDELEYDKQVLEEVVNKKEKNTEPPTPKKDTKKPRLQKDNKPKPQPKPEPEPLSMSEPEEETDISGIPFASGCDDISDVEF